MDHGCDGMFSRLGWARMVNMVLALDGKKKSMERNLGLKGFGFQTAIQSCCTMQKTDGKLLNRQTNANIALNIIQLDFT